MNVSLDDEDQEENKDKQNIVFSIWFHNPKMLLTVGDLTNCSSCLDYKIGANVQTLPSYIMDAHIIGFASFVISKNSFDSEKDFRKLFAH